MAKTLEYFDNARKLTYWMPSSEYCTTGSGSLTKIIDIIADFPESNVL